MEASPPSPVTAAPLDVAPPSVSDALVSENAPVALYTSGERIACANDLWMLIAIAAATDTPPELVSADGVSLDPASPSPPLVLSVSLAKLRCSVICWSTPSPSSPALPASGAPAADAMADVVEVDVVEALMERE